MAISNLLTAGQSTGGSVGSNISNSASNAYGYTNGTSATNASIEAAKIANAHALEMWNKTAQFNAAEAEKNRKWQEEMANTTYQRTVQDMIKAGVNPILAANIGLNGAGVGSGATATIANPNTFMSNAYADSYNEEHSASSAEGHSKSWEQSTSGLETFIDQMGGMIKGLVDGFTNGKKIQLEIPNLKEALGLYSADNAKKNGRAWNGTIRHN